MPSLRIALASLCLLTCVACSPALKVRPGKPVTITHTEYIALAASLTDPCAAPTPADTLKTWGDVLDAYVRDAGALQACAAKVQGIRKIQPAPTGSVGIPWQTRQLSRITLQLPRESGLIPSGGGR